MMEVIVKIISIFNPCLIIGAIWYIGYVLNKHTGSGIVEIARCAWYMDFNCFKRNQHYVYAHMIRLSLVGILLVNISQLNTGYIYIRPNAAFLFGFAFYISFCLHTISSYRQIEKLRKENDKLKNKL